MNREQLVVTAGFVFIGVFTLAAWTVAATKPPLKHDPNLVYLDAPFYPAIERVRRRPPGPRPDFLIGNLRHLPKGRWYETFTAWQKIYGDMIYMTALGRGVLVINSLNMAEELAVKRSAIYSGRAHYRMLGDLMGWNWILTGMDPGAKHTESRKIIRQSLGSITLPRYDHIILDQQEKLLTSFDGFRGHPLEVLTQAVASVIIRVAYGDGVFEEIGENLIELNTATVRQMNWVAGQFWLVEYLPILKYLPDWTPGAEFKLVAKEGYELQNAIRHWPFTKALEHWGRGTVGTCLAAEHLETGYDRERLDLIRDVLGVLFGAGVDTTTFTITIFLSAVLSHPHVQTKIHAELEEIFGRKYEDLPSSNDRPNLPYLDAAWKEAMRWHPTLALGVPHTSLQDDIYNNSHIPKDTLVFFNAGFMCRDPRIWDEPDIYKPERWLEPENPKAHELPNIYDIIFGFGKRVCPGLLLADRVGFTFVAGILYRYQVVPIEGEPIPSPANFTFKDNVARYPDNITCSFKLRPGSQK